jgi:hypothetical protein
VFNGDDHVTVGGKEPQCQAVVVGDQRSPPSGPGLMLVLDGQHIQVRLGRVNDHMIPKERNLVSRPAEKYRLRHPTV